MFKIKYKSGKQVLTDTASFAFEGCSALFKIIGGKRNEEMVNSFLVLEKTPATKTKDT